MGKWPKNKKRIKPIGVSNRRIPLAVSANEEFDRKMTVTGKITEGTLPLQASFTITQLGLREPFIPADSEEGLQDSTGSDFGVLKETTK